MPFVKGKSGNPGGRPKLAHDIQALARAHTEDAIAALVDALGDRKTQVAAACALLDRGYGKPHQTSEMTVTRRTTEMSDDELAAIAAGGGERVTDAPLDPSQLN